MPDLLSKHPLLETNVLRLMRIYIFTFFKVLELEASVSIFEMVKYES